MRDCKAISTGEGNTQTTDATIFGFVATDGFANIFERCIANGTQGWGDIRYHYLISQDGTIYEGRWRGDQSANIFVEGGQTMVSNTDKIGVVLLGQFEPTLPSPAPGEPTPEALKSLIELLGALAYDQNLDPLGQEHHPIEGNTYPIISGHDTARWPAQLRFHPGRLP